MEENLVGRVRNMEIQPDEPGILTDEVMQSVIRRRYGNRIPSGNRGEGNGPLLETRRFRWALAAVAGLILGSFLVQESHVWMRVAQLERQVSIGVGSANANQSSRTVSDRLIESVTASENGRRIREELEDVLEVDEEWVLIRKDRLLSLLDSVQRLEGNSGGLQRMIRERGFVKRVLELIDIKDTTEIRKMLRSEETVRRLLRML